MHSDEDGERAIRVDLLTPVVALRAEQRSAITLQVRNDSDVIEQIVCTLPGMDAAWYEVSPVALNLFPGDVGELRLTLALPRTFPAGRHELTAAIAGRVGSQTVLQRLIVDVEPLFDTILVTNPSAITARRRGRFLVTLQNRGNAPSEMAVRASDSEAALALELDRPVMGVQPGEQQTTALFARGKRPWFGVPVVHTIDITAEQLPEVLAGRVTLRLKPRLTAGVITALTLGLIVAVWATVLLLSTNAAFGTDPPTKVVPENFSEGVGVGALDAAVFGGSLSGTVTALSNGAPLARITVEMYSASNTKFVTAVATGDKGAYALNGVLPGRYRLLFRADGFQDRWYPDATTATAAAIIQVQPQKAQGDLDQAMAGNPGALTATVVAADGSAVPVDVTAQALDTDAPEITVQGEAGQPVTFPDLPTPATYRISAKPSVATQNFLAGETTQALAAGQQVTTNPITLAASAGIISGTVVDAAGNPLGDITVSTVVDGKPAVTATPTNGSVGAFSFAGLPTPGTYVLDFRGAGVATKDVAIRLEAGQPATGQIITMTAATSTITGVVTANGVGLGGATVTVTGGGFASTATTFTANPPGSFTVTGVPTPGSYVVTVVASGWLSSTSTVTMAAGQPSAAVDVQLLPALGRVTGTVTLNGVPIGAATVTVSDGTKAAASTVSATVASARGTFEVDGLAPGIYTVTATYGAGTSSQAGPVTQLVTVSVNPDQPGPLVLAL